MDGGGTKKAERWSGSRLWLRWVGATVLGVVLAFAAFAVIFSITGDPGDALIRVLMIGFGLTIGSFQQRVLRQTHGDVRRWALATGIGLGALEPSGSTTGMSAVVGGGGHDEAA